MKSNNNKRYMYYGSAIILAIILAVYEHFFGSNDIDLTDFEAVSVSRVVDGDTFCYKRGNQEIKVRLIGIDTPESVATQESGKTNTAEGVIASDYTKSLISGQTVYLEYDVDTTDDYGRELCYVYLADGRMLNEILLENGYARTMTIQPNVKYEKEFAEIQGTARAKKIGFWDSFY